MQANGLELLGTSIIVNLRVESGVTFPVDAATGELFFQNGVGLHVYDGTDWMLSTTPGLATEITNRTNADNTLTTNVAAALETATQALANAATAQAAADAIVTPGLATATATTGSTTVDVTGYEVVRITINANTTLNLTGGVNGQKITLELVQDDTGSRVLTLGTSFRFGTDLTTVLLTTNANKTDRIGVIYNSSASKYDVVAFVRGFG